MLASATVENYLKAIYLGGAAAVSPRRLMPMGQLASALGVAPGTATTMVKTLAESGLVDYEPYAGVALTKAGERLAALVLRRHRLVELFLVRVMGYSWDEVHDEAEQLEHVVSDRLIDRIDEMLGRPETDPHGDPIPDSEGLVKPQEAQTLLTCPMHTPVTVTRVIDQDKSFLRFIEGYHLKPGESIEVEHRDTASDSVRVRGKNDQRITIGTRAASKLLVQVVRVLFLIVASAAMAHAQNPASPAEPFAITDNSLLVEEAFNQEPGIVQNMVNVRVGQGGQWETTFTQEWPIFSQRHQFAYTVPFTGNDGAHGFGDVQVHYRLQVSTERGARPAIAPRVTVFVPTGAAARGLGRGSPAYQINVPISRQSGNLYWHWNGGFTHSPAEEVNGAQWNLFVPHAGVSAIWRARAMLHPMMETLVEWREEAGGGSTERHTAITMAPGVRVGFNAGETQTVLAIAMPVERLAGQSTFGLIVYLSHELPFAH
jgi:DtxR family Mn-dependent transcriptional regulator